MKTAFSKQLIVLIVAASSGLASALVLVANAAENTRDPFWPIGYHGPELPTPTPRPGATPTPKVIQTLSPEEITEILNKKIAEAKSKLRTQGTFIHGDKVMMYIENGWRKQGDLIPVRIEGITPGVEYRLQILKLTEDTIEMKPVRVEN